MIRWTYFPKNKKITGVGLSVVKAFEKHESEISSTNNNHLIGSGSTDSHSNSVLFKVSKSLIDIGFQVEVGKKKSEKINIPVLFGEQGKALQSFDADAYFAQESFVLEVEAGVDALTYYKRGLPLWQIGNRLRLIPAQSFDEREANEHNAYQYSEQKELLSIAARRLIRTAVLVAENAARGRFPCNKPFAEAQMDYYRRTPGRRIGSTRAKRLKAGA